LIALSRRVLTPREEKMMLNEDARDSINKVVHILGIVPISSNDGLQGIPSSPPMPLICLILSGLFLCYLII